MTPVVLALAAVLADPAGAPASAIDPRAERVLTTFFAATKKLSSLTYEFEKTERFKDGTVFRSRHEVRQRMPHTLFVRSFAPNVGQEILFNPDVDSTNLVVHPNRFPFVTLHLDFRGARATDGEHHIATHMGFGYVASLLERALENARRAPTGERFAYDGRGQTAGVNVDFVTFYAGDRAPERVLARSGEALLDFAERVHADPYWIAYNNDNLGDELTQTLDDAVYLVPRYYGRRSVMAFARDTGLLIEQKTWDDRGALYEHYVYRNIVLAPVFAKTEFTPAHPDYNF